MDLCLCIDVPSPPTNLNISKASDNEYVVILQWSPPMYNGGASVTDYEIFVDEMIFVEGMMEAETTATMAMVELNFTGEHTFQIRALNCAGYSDNVSVTINFSKEC